MLAQTNHIPRVRVDEVLEMTGLTSVSGHQVLLFDEPVNGLNPDGVRWVRNLLKGLEREGRTVFVSSHLMSEMALTANEVIIIGAGRRPLSRQDPPVGAAGRACAARRQALISPEVFAPRRGP
jgi:energy-coupling factor transporter ATP-binding protein EcfA2